MKKEIEVEGTQYPITITEINEFERKYNLKLDNDYKEFLLKYNGGKPILNGFTATGLSARFNCIVPLRKKKEKLDLEVYYTFFNQGRKIPEDLLIIGISLCNDFICLSVKGDNCGKVYWCDRDWEDYNNMKDYEAVRIIANSFGEFIEGLHDYSTELEPVVSDYVPQEQKKEVINISHINKFQLSNNVKLPQEYIEYLLLKNGEKIEDNIINYVDNSGKEVESRIHYLYSITEVMDYFNLELAYKSLVNDDDIEGYLPVASDEGGNLFCVSLKEESFGEVYFWYHELSKNSKYNFPKIANDFNSFINSIKYV